MANNIYTDRPILTGGTTNAQVENQGFTYDQAGFSFNQAGWMYGGMYNVDQDSAPLISLAENISPTIAGYYDIYTLKPAPNHQQIVGPGWFLYVSQ